jgi:hypothetical protein
MTGIVSMSMIAGVLLAAQAAVPVTERTEAVEVRYGREDGQNVWQAGELHGTWSGMGSYRNLFGVSERRRTSANITVSGGSYADAPLSIRCSGGESELSLGWITFDKQDLVYSCTFSQNGETLDSRFELALQESGLFGMGRNERAGEFHHDGATLQFETQRLSGVAFPSGRVPGYVIRHEGEDVGGMDYGVMRSRVYLPGADDPLREPVTIAAIVLALFFDPANSGN